MTNSSRQAILGIGDPGAAAPFGVIRPWTLLPWIVAIGLVLPAGIASGLGYGPVAVAAAVVSAAFAIAAWNWRVLLLALVAFVPYTGIPSILLYPNVGPAALVKDVLFVMPLYVGVIVAVATHREPARHLGASLVPLALFASWVLAESFNPLLPSPLIALVGIRVWLLYIPLAVLTAYLVRTRAQLERLLTVFVIAGAPPAILGVIQAGLIANGHQDVAYALYGAAAAAVTQGFAQFQVESGGVIARVPSTFSFAGQYAGFTLAYVVVTYARWRLVDPCSRWTRSWAAAGFLLAILAALLSGSRGSFFLVPAILLLALLTEGRLSLSRVLVAAGVTSAFAAVLTSIGLSVPSLVQTITDTAASEFDYLVVQGFGTAAHLTILGLGTGVDTGASRYVLGGGDPFAATGGQWYESWYVKIWLELGVIGLALVAGAVWSIVRAATRALRVAPDEGVRATVSVVSAFLMVTLVYNIKGAYLDVDPVNVVFWVFVGFLLAIAGGLSADRSPIFGTRADVRAPLRE